MGSESPMHGESKESQGFEFPQLKCQIASMGEEKRVGGCGKKELGFEAVRWGYKELGFVGTSD